MQTVEQTPASQTAQATPGEQGSFDAAVQALQKMHTEAAPVEEQEASEPEEQADIEPDAEASDGEPDEATDEAGELGEVEFEGITFSVPAEIAEKLPKALLRQADYSRKMNEVSAKEKAYTQKLEEAEKYAQGVEKHAEAMANIRLLDERLKAFDQLDWRSLRSTNPAEYAAMAADVQSLRLSKAQAEQQAASVSKSVEEGRMSVLAEKREAMHKALQSSLKGWGDEMGSQLTQYATSSGVAIETLSTLTDPGIVVALNKAKLYDDLQKAKTGAQTKLKTLPPVLKPGAVKAPNKHADAMARLSKTRSEDDAIAALASRRTR